MSIKNLLLIWLLSMTFLCGLALWHRVNDTRQRVIKLQKSFDQFLYEYTSRVMTGKVGEVVE